MADTNMVRVGSAAVVCDANHERILLGKRAKNPNAGKWVMPGGKIEVGETINQAVIREVREETGYDVQVLDRLGIFEIVAPDEHSVFVLSECRVIGPNQAPLAGDDIAEAHWFTYEELNDVDLSLPCRKALGEVGWL